MRHDLWATRFPAICLAAALAAPVAPAAPTPFSRSAAAFVRDEMCVGINIGNTLDVPTGNETEWGNAKITRELIHAYKAKGFDTVRVPVTWSKRFDHDAPGHPIEPAFLARVKEVVGWCLDEGLVTIVNTHHESGGDGPLFIGRMADFILNPANHVLFHCYFDVGAPDGDHLLIPDGKNTTRFPESAAAFHRRFARPGTPFVPPPFASPFKKEAAGRQ